MIQEYDMSPQNGYGVYKLTKVNTASRNDLVLMLFDGLLVFLENVLDALTDGDAAGVEEYCTRSRRILVELLSSLHPESGGEIANNLQTLYLFCLRQLIEVSLKKDHQQVKDVISIISQLRDGWIGMEESDDQEEESLEPVESPALADIVEAVG